MMQVSHSLTFIIKWSHISHVASVNWHCSLSVLHAHNEKLDTSSQIASSLLLNTFSSGYFPGGKDIWISPGLKENACIE